MVKTSESSVCGAEVEVAETVNPRENLLGLEELCIAKLILEDELVDKLDLRLLLAFHKVGNTAVRRPRNDGV